MKTRTFTIVLIKLLACMIILNISNNGECFTIVEMNSKAHAIKVKTSSMLVERPQPPRDSFSPRISYIKPESKPNVRAEGMPPHYMKDMHPLERPHVDLPPQACMSWGVPPTHAEDFSGGFLNAWYRITLSMLWVRRNLS